MNKSAFFLSPEPPVAGHGGGGLRSASLLEYLQGRYRVQVASFTLPYHSKHQVARLWRNGWRFLRGRPPLFDRFSGFESQLAPLLNRSYDVAVIEHFWCAPYAAVLRPHCGILVLDLHNIESELARTHALAAPGLQRIALRRFETAYRRLEREWFPHFDVVLVASADDRARIEHPKVHVYPNALPEIAAPHAAEQDCIIFSGNLEYHPNVEAVRWFHAHVWPLLRDRFPQLEWRLAGCNEHAVRNMVAGDARITLTGAMNDSIAALAVSKVCVVPLLSGSGTRFKILEAWAAGRAVVSTTIGAEGLGARDGEHLLIADKPEEFAKATAFLLEDAALRKRLGGAGRALYLERFTWPGAWRNLAAAGL
jgi:polysaccharide biosynthesis protein PslH